MSPKLFELLEKWYSNYSTYQKDRQIIENIIDNTEDCQLFKIVAANINKPEMKELEIPKELYFELMYAYKNMLSNLITNTEEQIKTKL
jgi:hypothetical protein